MNIYDAAEKAVKETTVVDEEFKDTRTLSGTRAELAPYVGSRLKILATVESYSATKGTAKNDTTLLKNILLIDEGIELDHLWVLGKSLEIGKEVVFTAEVCEYSVVDDDNNAYTKYGITYVKNVVVNAGDISASIDQLNRKIANSEKCNRNNPAFAVNVIQEMMDQHGLLLVPILRVDKLWECKVTDIDHPNDPITMTVADSFSETLMKTRDIIGFFKDRKINTKDGRQ